MDLKLTTSVTADNPIQHDLELTNGQLTFIGGDITDTDSYGEMVAQRITCRLLIVRGEWYLDQRKGTPYREKIWGKAGIRTSESGIARIFADVVKKTPGVASVDNIDITLDRATRKLSVEITATTDMGTQVTIGDLDEPFIVRL